LHLLIGRLLIANRVNKEVVEDIFQVTDHFNRGHDLIQQTAEQVRVATLNLEAGRRAHQSTAFAAATQYFKQGIAILPKQAWQNHYALIFALTSERGVCECLVGHFEKS
jgi:predicted ATPase